MPKYELFSTIILTPMRFCMIVPSSCIVIWKPPSPITQTTSRSGTPSLAPSAAGRPKPIVPSPPEVMKLRVELNFE